MSDRTKATLVLLAIGLTLVASLGAWVQRIFGGG